MEDAVEEVKGREKGPLYEQGVHVTIAAVPFPNQTGKIEEGSNRK